MVRFIEGKYRPFIRPASPATRETMFDVENVPFKLKLLHNIFENGTTVMYDDQPGPGCFDEFGPFIVLGNNALLNGDRYVKTGYVDSETYPNTNTYYYLNSDGSFYVNNPDGSEFYKRCDGSEWYKAPTTAPGSLSPQEMPELVPGQAVGGTPVKLEVTVNLKLEGARHQAEEEDHEVSGCCSWATRWW